MQAFAWQHNQTLEMTHILGSAAAEIRRHEAAAGRQMGVSSLTCIMRDATYANLAQAMASRVHAMVRRLDPLDGGDAAVTAAHSRTGDMLRSRTSWRRWTPAPPPPPRVRAMRGAEELRQNAELGPHQVPRQGGYLRVVAPACECPADMHTQKTVGNTMLCAEGPCGPLRHWTGPEVAR